MRKHRPFQAFAIFLCSLTVTSCVAVSSFLFPSTAVTITVDDLYPARIGRHYSQLITASGGSGRYTYSLVSGTLPDGLSLYAASGEIAGTVASAAGETDCTFTVRAEDAADPSNAAEKTFTITIGSLLWRIMLYMGGDNSLSAAAIADLNELEEVNFSGAGIAVYALVDLQGEENSALYRLKHDAAGSAEIVSENLPLPTLGTAWEGKHEVNTGDPATLAAFLSYGEAAAPAENSFLVIWNHGTGWRSLAPPASVPPHEQIAVFGLAGFDTLSRSVCRDDTSGGDQLTTHETAAALTDRNLTVIGFDLCYGAMIEVMYELKDSARYFVASEEIESAAGWNYTSMFGSFIKSARTPEALLSALVGGYAAEYGTTAGATLSATDLSQLPELMRTLNDFSDALVAAATTGTIRDGLKALLCTRTEGFCERPGDLNIDLADMAAVVSEFTDYADTEAAALTAAVEKAIVENYASAAGNPKARGIAVHLTPVDAKGAAVTHAAAYFRDYAGESPLAFVADSHWTPASNADLFLQSASLPAAETGLLYTLFYRTY